MLDKSDAKPTQPGECYMLNKPLCTLICDTLVLSLSLSPTNTNHCFLSQHLYFPLPSELIFDSERLFCDDFRRQSARFIHILALFKLQAPEVWPKEFNRDSRRAALSSS